ncbi:nudix hydrolase 26, chloroplastic-like [Nymphaea colorata]|nr:nudix hydrolase 26, chloroplastic-like [Nymphaea colorata]
MAALLLRLPSSNGSAPLRHFPAVGRNASRPTLLPSKPAAFASPVPRLRPRAASASSLSSMETPPDGYRKNVGICLVNPSNKIFAASRLDVPDAWQMPQGGIDNDEDPVTAAVRELREETGVVSAEVLAEVPYWLTYDFPPEVKEKVNNLWGTNWKGQAQKWFLLRFTGKDEEINLAGDGTEAAEFGEWSWLPPQEIIDRAVRFKKPVYEEVLRFFAPHIQFDANMAL